jgi:hypothetical protein
MAMSVNGVLTKEEERRALRRLGSFHVDLVYHCANIKDGQRLSVHEQVIRPLLERATECRVYGLKRYPQMRRLAKRILVKEKGWWRLDLTQEVIKGYEPLWNASCARGSLVIVVSINPQESRALFRHTSKPNFWSSLYQIQQANARAAVRFCQNVAKTGSAAFLLPHTNGIEWMDVFAPHPLLKELFKVATRYGENA